MAKGFKIGNSDFDDLFESPYTNFATTTFSGLSPTCKYCTRYWGDNPNATGYYKYQNTILDASPKGFLPSNYRVGVVTTTGRWMLIKKETTGFSVNGSVFRNSNRGSYPINRVGLMFCGGGAGGAGADCSITEDGGGYYYNMARGAGGGGASTICVVLWLDKYNYYLYLGAGGAGGGGSTSSGGSGEGDGGENSYLRLNSSSGTLLATATGGFTTDESSPVINNQNYFSLISSAKGSAPGSASSREGYYHPDYGGYLDYAYEGNGSENSGTIDGYFSQIVTGSQMRSYNSGKDDYETWEGPDGTTYYLRYGNPGVCAMPYYAGSPDRGYGGYGGDAYYDPSSWEGPGIGADGDAGIAGAAYFYY